jgi:hypothetical protein
MSYAQSRFTLSKFPRQIEQPTDCICRKKNGQLCCYALAEPIKWLSNNQINQIIHLLFINSI